MLFILKLLGWLLTAVILACSGVLIMNISKLEKEIKEEKKNLSGRSQL
ncbi:MAG: hypothetical protein HQK76_13140 [Desulfobacterales bacterium]|nr:hypothetical protein [Desulfobacterales bacterium]